jgi:hypothetical protein
MIPLRVQECTRVGAALLEESIELQHCPSFLFVEVRNVRSHHSYLENLWEQDLKQLLNQINRSFSDLCHVVLKKQQNLVEFFQVAFRGRAQLEKIIDMLDHEWLGALPKYGDVSLDVFHYLLLKGWQGVNPWHLGYLHHLLKHCLKALDKSRLLDRVLEASREVIDQVYDFSNQLVVSCSLCLVEAAGQEVHRCNHA